MARKTKSEAARTRDAILDAAETEMQARGIAGASFERIAKRAHVTRGAIYWHFDDKNALLAAMVERTYLPLRDLQRSLRSQAPDQGPQTTLRAMLLHGLERLATDAHHRKVCDILTNCSAAINENHPVASLMRTSFEDSRNVVHELCRSAENSALLSPCLTPGDATDMVMAFMCGVYNCSLRHGDLYPAKRDWVPIVDALLNGLFVGSDTPEPTPVE